MPELELTSSTKAPEPAEPPESESAVPTRVPERMSSAALASAEARRISPPVLRGSVRLLDYSLASAIGAIIYILYVAPVEPDAGWLYGIATAATTFGVVLILEVLGLYRTVVFSTLVSQLSRLVTGWTGAFGMLTAALFFTKAGEQFSRIWLGTWYVSGLAGLMVARGLLASLVRRWERDGRVQLRTIIVGDRADAEGMALAFQRSSAREVQVRAIIDDGRPGDLELLEEMLRNEHADLVVLSLPLAHEDRLLKVYKRISVYPVDIRLSADASRLRFRPRAYSYVGGQAMLDVLDRPISDWDEVNKWLFDRVVGIVALLLALPVMAIIAVAIKLDSRGPILFKQARYGFNNELIEVYKFRSMYTEQTDAHASKLVTRDDPRVTRIGRFIRKTSLDELPQLFNVVLFGNLSLVGPRPHAVKAKAGDALYQDVVDGYFARHRVKPGITGWAQINGWRGETDTHEKIQQRVAHDLYYIEHWSVLFDLYILLKTPWSLLRGQNAY